MFVLAMLVLLMGSDLQLGMTKLGPLSGLRRRG